MIIKPANYDSQEGFTGDYEVMSLGGHVCKIERAIVEETQYGKRLIIAFDVAEGEHKGFYRRQYDRKKAQDANAKWAGIVRQNIPTGDGSDSDNKAMGFFKGLMINIEKSNPGYTWNWDEKTLTGKLFGGVFGQEEFKTQTGEIKLATKCVQVRTVEAVRAGVEAPPVKKLKQENQQVPAGWATPPEDDQSTRLPFDI